MTAYDHSPELSSAPAEPEGWREELDQLAAELEATRRQATRLEQELAALRLQVEGSGPRFAALYADFTDQFRGTTAEVMAKLRGYLPDVHRLVDPLDHSAADGRARVVDVGCGRGEWLQVLGEAGVPALGVDASPDFVAAGRARGLEIVQADAVAYLESQTSASLDLVTAFHLVEHLDVDTLLALFAAARRALRPGGGLLLETPNPTNVVMGACNFYLDPTHRSPLPPRLTAYLVSASGFIDVEVRPLHPDEFPLTSEPGTPIEQLVARTLAGPRDYAVLGYAAAGP